MKHKLSSAFRLGLPVLLGALLVTLPGDSLLAKTTPALGNGDLELAHRLQNAFVKVADDASESVVVITSKRKLTGRSAMQNDEENSDQFEGTPFEFFFKRLPKDHPRDIDSQGSGIIYRADGYILTNNHVVDGADEIRVRLKDGRELDATVVGTDDRTDVAVIKVNDKNLPAANIGDSEQVKVGQWAIAIGAPYELDYSFTVGFVSAKGRSAVWSRAGSAYEDYIQTDASINPGNSGGPLCDIDGRVIGINTLIRGLNRGIGFAIPINMARDIADQLIDKGKITRPWIGIQIEALADNKELAEAFKDVKEGVLVRAIYPDTPAANSDLKPADVIVAVDGVKVKTPRDLQRQVLRKAVGEKVALDVVRDGRPIKVALQTGELPETVQVASSTIPGKPKAEAAYGLTVQTLNKDLADRLNVKETQGVVVTDVADGSVAAEHDMQRGDVITEVDRTPVKTADDFQKAISNADAKRGALLYVKRNGTSTFVVLKDSK